MRLDHLLSKVLKKHNKLWRRPSHNSNYLVLKLKWLERCADNAGVSGSAPKNIAHPSTYDNLLGPVAQVVRALC